MVRAADQTPSRPTEKKPRPDQSVNCPRCNSTNTKFCYYNNYSLSQPRYFCKTCRRYWTEGGTLRNVPVGGASRRKHKSSSSKKSTITDLAPPPDQNPNKFNPPIYNGIPHAHAFHSQNPNFSSADSSHLSFMDLLKTTAPTSVFDSFSSGLFPMQPTTSSFSLDRFQNGYGSFQDHTRTGFPFEEPKPVSNDLDSNGYWNGVLPGGSW